MTSTSDVSIVGLSAVQSQEAGVGASEEQWGMAVKRERLDVYGVKDERAGIPDRPRRRVAGPAPDPSYSIFKSL